MIAVVAARDGVAAAPVRRRAAAERLASEGVTTYVEVGSGAAAGSTINV